MPAKAQVTLTSDRVVGVTGQFIAALDIFYDAHTIIELFRFWLVGYPVWVMAL
jgi:hypothetical protein